MSASGRDTGQLSANYSHEIDTRGVARLPLARPAVFNAFDEVIIAELASAFGSIAEDSAVRCVMLAAEGKLFCAGADIEWMQRQSRRSHDENLCDARGFAEMMRTIYESPKPVIACIQGHAFGGGVGLMAAADIVIASRNAGSEAKFGILPSVIGASGARLVTTAVNQLLRTVAGLRYARCALVSGRTLPY
jgi:methylglutaconyl-CoA hydratase